MQTILGSAVVSTVIISYFLAAESLMQMIMQSFPECAQFDSVLMYMAISTVVIIILCAFVISDDEDGEGGSGFSLTALRDKAVTLSTGILYSRTGAFYMIVLTIYMIVLVFCLFSENLVSEGGTSALLVLIAFNLLIPVLIFKFLDEDTIEGWADTVTDHEKDLLDKGVDVSLGDAATSL